MPEPRPNAADEEELARRTREGDEDAARILFERLRPRMRAYVRRKMPRALRVKVAESDVIQDAYLAAFSHLSDFEDRGDGSFARWLAAILDRKLLDEVRRYVETDKRAIAREHRLRTTEHGARLPGRLPTPSAGAIDAEERAQVEAAIRELSPSYREVLALVHEKGATFEEAGRAMGRSPEAVRKLYSRAVLALGDRLGPDERA